MERLTRQRAAIYDAIAESARPLTPHEVLDLAQATVKRLGISTVYRAVKALVDDGSLKVVNLPGEVARYEPAERGHHHHFQCTSCARVFDVDGCPGNMKNLAPRGFTVERHELTLYGRCSECKPSAANADSRPGSAN